MSAVAALPDADAELDWQRDGADWPLREYSRFVDTPGLRWHVQQLGQGPEVLLVHGTGAASHSWRDLAPLLAARFTVTTLDLPGHGFTCGVPRGGLSLDGMADALHALLQALRSKPMLAVGHSAGAAILARLCVDRRLEPAMLVSLNGALLPLSGAAAILFPPLAKLLALSTLPSRLFVWGARDRQAVVRLLTGTGSTIDERGVDLYARLVRCRSHVDGALRMMANWDLRPLERALPRLPVPLLQIVGAEDRTVSPREAQRVAACVPGARTLTLPGLGHLAHEERADRVAALIVAAAESAGIASSGAVS